MLVQAWQGILPQHGSASDGSVCTGRSNWRVQARMKMAGNKAGTEVQALLILVPIVAAIPNVPS